MIDVLHKKGVFLDHKMDFVETSKNHSFLKGFTHDFYHKFKVLSSSSFEENKARNNDDWCSK